MGESNRNENPDFPISFSDVLSNFCTPSSHCTPDRLLEVFEVDSVNSPWKAPYCYLHAPQPCTHVQVIPNDSSLSLWLYMQVLGTILEIDQIMLLLEKFCARLLTFVLV